MRLPPLTLREALALHQRILESGGDILALTDTEDLALHLMAGMVAFGAQLSRDKDVITTQMAEIASLKASLEDINAQLRAYIDAHLAERLETDLSDESLTENSPELSEGEQTWLRALGVVLSPEDDIEVGDIQGVGWSGKAKDYFDHFPEINKELAKGISEMARQQIIPTEQKLDEES